MGHSVRIRWIIISYTVLEQETGEVCAYINGDTPFCFLPDDCLQNESIDQRDMASDVGGQCVGSYDALAKRIMTA